MQSHVPSCRYLSITFQHQGIKMNKNDRYVIGVTPSYIAESLLQILPNAKSRCTVQLKYKRKKSQSVIRRHCFSSKFSQFQAWITDENDRRHLGLRFRRSWERSTGAHHTHRCSSKGKRPARYARCLLCFHSCS